RYRRAFLLCIRSPAAFIHWNGRNAAGDDHFDNICVACLGMPCMWDQAVEWWSRNIGRQVSALPHSVVHSQTFKWWSNLSLAEREETRRADGSLRMAQFCADRRLIRILQNVRRPRERPRGTRMEVFNRQRGLG